MTLSPDMLERIRQGWGDVPEIRLLLDENERLRRGVVRVEYAWENLRGWMPSGRGVTNWTRELSDAIHALGEPAP